MNATERRVEAAITMAAKHFGVQPREVLKGEGPGSRSISRARGVAMTLCVMVFKLGTVEVSGIFNRDHTTVGHARRKYLSNPAYKMLASRLADHFPRG